MIKALDTYYNGYMFRSRLEARWAVFFDSCGVQWEYEAQGCDLGDGIWYLPDFVLHDVTFNHGSYSSGNDLYVEVKGHMTKSDADKIKAFSKEKPILLVEEIPVGEKMIDLCYCMDDAVAVYDLTPYNFETVDGDWFGAYPGVDLDGTFNLFGADSSYFHSCDERATINAYRNARCARFGQGDVIVEKLKKGVI
jgi:hypothetical protein